jgi:integrase/recombinase XerD
MNSSNDYLNDSEIACRVERYLEWLRLKNYSDSTIQYETVYLNRFIRWLSERNITRPVDVTPGLLEHYRRHVSRIVKPNGKNLSINTQYLHFITIRGFFRFLYKNNYIIYNPAADLELPRLSQPLPHHVLSESEVESILRLPNVRTLLGLRDRAILEVFYATGIRRKELGLLKLSDIDLDRGILLVREGKYKKDRVVPLGERSGAWLRKYIEEARPLLVRPPDEGILFVSRSGKGINYEYLSQLVGEYVAAAGVEKPGGCHLFRHSMATLMLEGGADIRYVQEMLGHANLQTTQIYTKIAINKLKEVHARAHPGANLNPRVNRDLEE